MHLDQSRVVSLLHRWGQWAERWWYALPGMPDLGCHGTGYDAWGVQTNQKYVATMAMLSTRPELSHDDRAWARQRALAALRFSLRSHHSGSITCTDGKKWGHTWISGLGIERMMHGVAAIDSDLNHEDRVSLRRVLESECDWLMTDYRRGNYQGIQADKWGNSGKNDPESNLWNGALLWRSAAMFPDHPHAARWSERALAFLAAGVCIAADANDATLYDGKPLRERHIGANFFDSFALDHHGYFNVGYMMICVSNAALLHFDMKHAGLSAPQLLHLHQKDLWRTMRPMIFPDGRLARLGGDSRVRYAYCQEYTVPAALYAADHLEDPGASELLVGYLNLVEKEADYNGDGSFYGRRLSPRETRNPYYYIRLENDRAAALGMALAYAPAAPSPTSQPAEPPIVLWSDREYGAAMHRSATRLASFAWRAHGIAQGLCLPPDCSDMAEWEANLTGEIAFVTDPPAVASQRSLVRQEVRELPGGFITSGTFAEGARVTLAEGWNGSDLAMHYLAFVALPDDRTVVGIQVCRTGPLRTLVRGTKGLLLNLPNDLFNGFKRQIETIIGVKQLPSASQDEVMNLNSPWMTVDGRLSVVGLYGAPSLVIDRSASQRGGGVPSINVDQICYGHRTDGPFFTDPNTVLLDCAWIVATTDAPGARNLATQNAAARFETGHNALRAVTVCDTRGNRHTIVLNASEESVSAKVAGRSITLAAGGAEYWKA